MVYIRGQQILSETKERAQSLIPLFERKKVTIIRFDPPSEVNEEVWSKHEAARYSTEAKKKTFESMGCQVEEQRLDSQISSSLFERILVERQLDPNVLGVIIQHPIPLKVQERLSILSPEKDLDGMNPNHPNFVVSATSETIFRLVNAFADTERPVAVVGARGFVGAGVVQLLQQAQIPCIPLELGDDLRRTNEASIIVSATGVAEILDQRHINSDHKLVVDVGFIPTSARGLLGDINRTAYDVPENITPVPGGIGPMQMATLLERSIQVLGQKIEPWAFITPEQKLYAQQILPTAVELIREQGKANALQQVTPTLLEHSGQNYRLRFDLEQQVMTIQAQDGRGDLLRARKTEEAQAQITMAARLTPADVNRWQKIQQFLIQLRTQEQRRGGQLER
jgi:methylenetetrahydrofolate dehydrogenase (NADP+) / methenyltetrahydrofolate cyclohydrolase